jgi:hypothetical protein
LNTFSHPPTPSLHFAALFFRLKQRGFEECDDKARQYAGKYYYYTSIDSTLPSNLSANSFFNFFFNRLLPGQNFIDGVGM